MPRLVAYANTFGVMLFLVYAAARHPDWIRPTDSPSLRTAGAYIWLCGALLSLWPLWYLRRSFSVEPEARDLVTSGPYRWARHPIYAVYLLINGGILLSHFTVPLAAVLAGWLVLLLVRIALRGAGPGDGLPQVPRVPPPGGRVRTRLVRRERPGEGAGVRPSLFDIIFVIWAVVVPVGFGYRLLNSDGDLARHLRLGEVMLDQRGLLRTDVFSFTRAGQPFLAFEYGSELLYAGAYRLAGLAGVAVLAGLVLALTYALVARFLIRRGGDPLLAYLVSMVAAVLSAAHWLARPHLFTMLLVVVLLELLQYTGRRALWLYALLFVVWANLHGGFSFGCILIGLYAAGEADRRPALRGPGALVRPRAPPSRGARRGAARRACSTRTATSSWRTSSDSSATAPSCAQTQEFMSPDFQTINGKIFLLALLGVIGALAWSRRRPPVPTLLVLLANDRLRPALPAEHRAVRAHGPAAAWPCTSTRSGGRCRCCSGRRRCSSGSTPGSTPASGAVIVALLLVGLAVAGGQVAGVAVVPNRFDEKAFPVRAAARGAGGRASTAGCSAISSGAAT